MPRSRTQPRWETRAFPTQGGIQLLASGLQRDAGKGALFINQDAALFGGPLADGEAFRLGLNGSAYLLISKGEVAIGDAILKAGDGAAVSNELSLHVKALGDSELVIIDLPTLN
jgi:hypothetical protein